MKINKNHSKKYKKIQKKYSARRMKRNLRKTTSYIKKTTGGNILNYLDELNIIDIAISNITPLIIDELKEIIIKKSFYDGDTYYFDDIDSKLNDVIKPVIPNVIDNDWIDCKDKCADYCIKLVSREIHSTAYVLKLLANSIIGTAKIQIVYDNAFNLILTGKWINDSKYFNIQFIDSKHNLIINDYNGNETGRLIMGFGPSASGKTYCASKIIELMKKIDITFPEFFISIDGGLYREKSFIYQKIIEICKNKKIPGLYNLVSASVLTTVKTIFDSNIIKRYMKQYLLLQSKTKKINLYVPDTITGCILNCSSLYSDYITITRDKNWIGLMIYQHRSGVECPYRNEYKCLGCKQSGESREKNEGKKYSDSSWKISYDHGNYEIMHAPNYRFRVHNSGGRKDNSGGQEKYNKTILEDFSKEKIDGRPQIAEIKLFLTELNWEYSNGEFSKV
jgi:hypothetical protein